MALTREQLIAVRSSLPRQMVDLEGVGTVAIRTLTLREVTELQKQQKAHADEPVKLYPVLLKAACVDDDGNPLFVGDDSELIDSLPWPAIETLVKAITKLNGMGGDDAPKAG